jgi:microcystin-dependent protein
MPEPYIGEIRMFAGTFNPVGWEFCNGQLMPISENEALFQLIGTTYGGDGESTFALPNLQSRVPVHAGQRAGSLNTYVLGEMVGVEQVTLTVQQIPAHVHPMMGTTNAATTRDPVGALPGQAVPQAYTNRMTPAAASAQAISPVGGSQPHENMQPYLCINFIISLFGVFPTQT